MLIAYWLFLLSGLLLVLGFIIARVVIVIKPINCVPIPAINTGGCILVPCSTGPTGAGQGTGSAGPKGVQGMTGPQGISIRPMSYGVLVNSVILQIQTNTQPYSYLVTVDARPDLNAPPSLLGDKSGHIIVWLPDQQVWHDQGPWTGEPGVTGPANFTVGPMGPTGLTGSIGLIGPRGPTGPVGIPGTTGIALLPPTGGNAMFGDGSDGSFTLSSDFVMSRDMQWLNLIVPAGRRLITAGWIVRSQQFINNNGSIENNGQGGDGLPNPAPLGGAGGAAGRFSGGGDGGTPSSTMPGDGNNSYNAFSTGGFFLTTGPNNYSGGYDTRVSVATGGVPGIVNANNPVLNLGMLLAAINPMEMPFGGSSSIDTSILISGGSGGAAPVNAPGTQRNSGGGGGGVVCICSPVILGSGFVTANGGNAGPLALSPSSPAPAAGGGGGGNVFIRTLRNSSTWTIQANGGLSGLSDGTANGYPGRWMFL